METKDVCLVITVVVLSVVLLLQSSEMDSRMDAYIELENNYDSLSSLIEYHNDELFRCYDRHFERDCLLRGYSSYYLENGGGRFCCKWFNNTRICNSWFDVMHYAPVYINLRNFTTEENATILIERAGGDIYDYPHRFMIILPEFEDAHLIHVYDYDGYVKIDCHRW